jgi:deoxyribodipyrimidine photo-lyase
MIQHKVNIVWFRQDLRLSDNPALCEAAQRGKVLPIYILDDENSADHRMGAAGRFWLHHSLIALDKTLNHNLSLYVGGPLSILVKLTEFYGVKTVFWNRCYEPWRIKRDKHIRAQLKSRQIQVCSYNGSLLWKPWNTVKRDGTSYKVFTPFYRKGCQGCPAPRRPMAKPETVHLCKDIYTML